MITLKNLMKLMPYAACDLEPDSFLQIVDSETGAHYRKVFSSLMLGGDLISIYPDDIFDFEVTCIEYENDHCVISVKGR
jgi:hypothetical protein